MIIEVLPATAQNLSCSSSTTLESLITCIYGHMPRAGGGFVIPSAAAQADWRTAVTEMMKGNCSTMLPLNLAGIMERRTFVDSANGRSYCVLMEVQDANNNNVVDRGWGTFITYDNAVRELNFMAPHPIYDIATHSETMAVFRDMEARSFAMGGAHRNASSVASSCNSAYPISDPAHTKENMMFETTAALLAYYGTADWHMVQFHAKDDTSCSGAGVVMADGVAGAPTPDVHSLYLNMKAYHPTWKIVEPASGYTCLQATDTIMGRLMNGVAEADVCTKEATSPSGRFLHMEQNSTSRLPGDWTPALQQTFPVVPLQSPAAPTNLAATAGNGQVSLSWTASPGATGYTVMHSTTSGGPYAIMKTGMTATSFNDAGLTNGITYYYVVSASNARGESPQSNQASAMPMGIPAPPANLTATSGAAGSKSIILNWTASPGATGYLVYRATSAYGTYSLIKTGLAATTYSNTGLRAGKTYYYKVKAVNTAGKSTYSNIAHAASP